MKLFKKLSKDVKKYQKDVDTMTADLDQVNMTARWGVDHHSSDCATIAPPSVSTRHTNGVDSMTVVDAVMTGTICGPNVSRYIVDVVI